MATRSSATVQETKSTTDKRVVMSYLEKLHSVTPNTDGSLTHNIFKMKDGSPRKFKDEETHKKWVTKHVRERKEFLKARLSPI